MARPDDPPKLSHRSLDHRGVGQDAEGSGAARDNELQVNRASARSVARTQRTLPSIGTPSLWLGSVGLGREGDE